MTHFFTSPPAPDCKGRPLVFLGIDPGATGALAALDEEGNALWVEDFDRQRCLDVLRRTAEEADVATVCLESVHAMPGQGVSSTFRFGENFGWWQGAVQALLNREPLLVAPSVWMRHYGLVKAGKSDKPSLGLARRCFPNIDLHLKKHNGRSDALCIAAYGLDGWTSGR